MKAMQAIRATQLFLLAAVLLTPAPAPAADEAQLNQLADILQREIRLLEREEQQWRGKFKEAGAELPSLTKEAFVEAPPADATPARKVELLEKRVTQLKRRNFQFKRAYSDVAVQITIAEISQQVARLRGLPLKKPVEFDYLSRPKFIEFLDAAIEEQYPNGTFAEYEFCMKRLGFIAPDIDLRKLITALYGEQVAGLYDDETGKLFVMKEFGLETGLAKIILAHEICHALQDQHYDVMERGLRTKDDDDRVMAAASILEGDATILMSEWTVDNLSLKFVMDLPKMLMMDQQAYNSAPKALQEMLIFPYISGMQFMQVRKISLPPREYDKIFADPPQSTEQILHQEKYFGFRDNPTTVALSDHSEKLGRGWKRVFSNVMGELGVKLTLQVSAPERAASAAAGWDGDRFELYRNNSSGGKAYLLVWATAWDSTPDAKEFAKVFQAPAASDEKVFKEQKGQLVIIIISNDARALKRFRAAAAPDLAKIIIN